MKATKVHGYRLNHFTAADFAHKPLFSSVISDRLTDEISSNGSFIDSVKQVLLLLCLITVVSSDGIQQNAFTP